MYTDPNASHFGKKHIPVQCIASFSIAGDILPLYFKPTEADYGLFYDADADNYGSRIKIEQVRRHEATMGRRYFYCEVMSGDLVKTMCLEYETGSCKWTVEI